MSKKNMEKYINRYRHGDIEIYGIESIPSGADKVPHHGSHILAHGEVTNHKHVITVADPKDMVISKTSDGRYFFELKSMGTVTHEEHKTIEIMPGKYEMKREREYDYFSQASRRVID